MTLRDQKDGYNPSPITSWTPEHIRDDEPFTPSLRGDVGAAAFTSLETHQGQRSAIEAPLDLRMALPVGLPSLDAHPLYLIDRQVEQALRDAGDWQSALGEETGDGPIHPACLIRASLLQALYSFRSDQQFIEQLHYNLLYRWFVGLRQHEPVWDAAVYARARKVLHATVSGGALLRGVLQQARTMARMWSERFHVDEDFFDTWSGPVRGDLSAALLEQKEASTAVGAASMQRSRNDRLDKALALILQRIGDPGLSPDAIASALHMSRRALYLLFEKHGLTPIQAVRDIRMECCKKALSDPRQQSRKIIDIALDFGLAHASTFCRQFKQRYGVSAREARVATFTLRGVDA